jgi:hypothetical protein
LAARNKRVGSRDLANISVRQQATYSGAFLNEAIRAVILIVALYV